MLNNSIVDKVIVALDSHGPISTALEVIQIATKAAASKTGDIEETVQSVRMAIIKVLSGPDGELYTPDDLLPESVMRDLIDVMNTGLVEQLVRFFTLKKKWIGSCACLRR